MTPIEEKLEQDIKTALLARDSQTATTLRGLKAAILNVKVATGTRDSGMAEADILALFAKEAKKRQESADLYKQGGNETKAADELAEKELINTYLPTQLSEDELLAIIKKVITETGASGPQGMGQVIGKVKAETGPAGDGALIARLVKEQLA